MAVALDPAGDRRQRLQVRGRRGVGRDDQKQQPHRLAVGRFEVDALAQQPDRHDHVAQALDLAVRHRDAVPEGGAAQLLALEQPVVEQIGVLDDVRADHELGKSAQNGGSVRSRQIDEDQVGAGE